MIENAGKTAFIGIDDARHRRRQSSDCTHRAQSGRMMFTTTRGGETGLSFVDVLLNAYGPLGGLYVPEEIPTISKLTLASWAGLPLAGVCAHVLKLYTGLSFEELLPMTTRAFAGFNASETDSVPLRSVGSMRFLDASLGPTLAFKDIGQQVVAQLLNHYLGREGRHANILVETSGDTGPAAIDAVRGCEHVDIYCLYPEGRITSVQEMQMTTVDAPNVHVFQTKGNTDEQAEVLKELFGDKAFVEANAICSINSINWARILAQSTYYVWAYLKLYPEVDGVVDFSVPTGACGNAVGGLLAKKMGLPIGTILCATNANDIVHRTFETGDMTMQENQETVSPAMDIQMAYNMERIIYFATGGDVECVREVMASVEDPAVRGAQLRPELLATLRKHFVSCSVSDEETETAISRVQSDHGFTLCPHSAVGVHAAHFAADASYSAALRGDALVCVLTAHPAKFPDVVQRATALPLAAFTTASVEGMRKLPADNFTVLAKEGPAWREEWKRTLQAAVAARSEVRLAAAAAAVPQSTLRTAKMVSSQVQAAEPAAIDEHPDEDVDDLWENHFGDSGYFTAKYGAVCDSTDHPEQEDGVMWTCPLCQHVDSCENFERELCDGCFQEGFEDWKEELRSLRANANGNIRGAGSVAEADDAKQDLPAAQRHKKDS